MLKQIRVCPDCLQSFDDEIEFIRHAYIVYDTTLTGGNKVITHSVSSYEVRQQRGLNEEHTGEVLGWG